MQGSALPRPDTVYVMSPSTHARAVPEEGHPGKNLPKYTGEFVRGRRYLYLAFFWIL